MIGREREREALRGAVDQAAMGDDAFLLIVGEPGIGKTTLLRALSDLAHDAGLAVGHGRAEPDGTTPMWPWTSTFAALDVPTADERSTTSSALETERFAVFERFAAELTARAAAGPVALIVDDLHWADVTALRLLRHLLDRSPMSGVLLAAGLRTTEPLAVDAAEVVSGLLAHPSVDVIEVAAFGEAEVAAFAGATLARPASDGEVAVLAERSGGNPFLLGELLRWLPDDASPAMLAAALPLAVRESVRRRLVVEDALTQQIVKTAAVAGAIASLDRLAAIARMDRADVGRALDAAIRAGLVVVERSGSVSFVHDLVRQAVLSVLPTWSRIQLHHDVGMTLRDDIRSSSWAAVAAHLTSAGPLVSDDTLADVSHQAALEATRAGAFDEAADHLAVVLDATAVHGDTAARGQLLLERGRQLWAAERADESKAVLEAAIALARRTSDSGLLAQVALSWRGGEMRVILRRTDDEFVALLREALAAEPPVQDRLRCLLLARLALCAHWDIGDRDGVATCEEAVSMARRLDDPEVLASALATRFYYRWRPELVHERLAIADEILAVALAAGDAGMRAQASYLRLLALLDIGWLREAWSELARFEDASAVSSQPLLRLRALWFRATRHIAAGERPEAHSTAVEACRLATRMGRPDAAVEQLGQALVLLAPADQVDNLLQMIHPVVRRPVTYHSIVAVANGLAGRRAEANAALTAVVAAGLERQPRDMSWLFGQCGLLGAAAVSGDRDTGEHLYDTLEPFAGLWAVLNPGIVVLGAVDHFLGLGAALLGRTDAALDHLRRAAEVHEREDAVPLALLSLHELVTVLSHRRRPCDEAEAVAAGSRIARLEARNTVPFKPVLGGLLSPTRAASAGALVQRLVLEGDTWLVEFGGRRTACATSEGCTTCAPCWNGRASRSPRSPWPAPSPALPARATGRCSMIERCGSTAGTSSTCARTSTRRVPTTTSSAPPGSRPSWTRSSSTWLRPPGSAVGPGTSTVPTSEPASASPRPSVPPSATSASSCPSSTGTSRRPFAPAIAASINPIPG